MTEWKRCRLWMRQYALAAVFHQRRGSHRGLSHNLRFAILYREAAKIAEGETVRLLEDEKFFAAQRVAVMAK